MPRDRTNAGQEEEKEEFASLQAARHQKVLEPTPSRKRLRVLVTVALLGPGVLATGLGCLCGTSVLIPVGKAKMALELAEDPSGIRYYELNFILITMIFYGFGAVCNQLYRIHCSVVGTPRLLGSIDLGLSFWRMLGWV